MPILLLLIPLFAVFLFFKPKKRTDLSDFHKGGDPETKEDYGEATISKNKATSLAIQLYNEMASVFTSEATLMNTLKGLTEFDYIMIFDAFGEKKRDPIFSGGSTILGTYFNLTEWLNLEITSSKNIEKLKALFPKHF